MDKKTQQAASRLAASVIETSLASGGLLAKLVVFACGLVVGAVVGVFGLYAWQVGAIGQQDEALEASVVFDRVVEQSEMVGASQDYSIVEKVTDSNKFMNWNIPFTQNSFWYRCAGTIKAGVNLKDAKFRQDGSTVYVKLSDPYIISNTPDMAETGVLEEKNNILNPIHVEDTDALRQKCVQMSEDQALESGLLDRARDNVQENVRDMFTAALGDTCTVEFE